MNPKFAHTLSGTIADERRHVGFGENHIGSLIREYRDKKPEVEKLQKEMSYYMLATFADRFRDRAMNEERERMRAKLEEAGATDQSPPLWHGLNLAEAPPEELEAVLSGTVLKEFKLRLGRIGIDYQTPARP